MMWTIPKGVRVYLRLGITDMRKSIQALSLLVKRDLRKDPGSGDLFAFCNRRRRLIKILYWDHNGFCLWQKRLEEQQFRWPYSDEELLTITARELNWLLAGLDFQDAHQRLHNPMVI